MPCRYLLYWSFNMNTNISYTHGLETKVFCELVSGRKSLGRNVQTLSSDSFQVTDFRPLVCKVMIACFNYLTEIAFLGSYLCYWFFLDIGDWQLLFNHWVRCKPGLWMCHEIYNLDTFLNASESPLTAHILALCNLKFPAQFHIFPWNKSGKCSFIFSFQGRTGKLPSNM